MTVDLPASAGNVAAPLGDFAETAARPCFACRQVAWRERPSSKGGGLVCDVCHPDPERLYREWLASKTRAA